MRRRSSLSIVAVLGTLGCHAGPGGESRFPPPTGPAIRRPAAGSAASPGAEVLLRDVAVRFDERGRCTFTVHRVFRIASEEGLKDWGMVSASYSPYYEERPRLLASVRSPEGGSQELDPKTIAEMPDAQPDSEVLIDRRVVRAPLPALRVGSVVDTTTVMKETRTRLGTGSVHRVYLPPARRYRVSIEAPASLPLKHAARGLSLSPRTDERSGGLRRVVYEGGPLPEPPEIEPMVSADVTSFPYLVFSTASSWSEVASAYSEVIEGRLRGARLDELVRDAAGDKAPVPKKVERILELVRRRVRYTGVELDTGALVPAPPDETLRRRYGDCKDLTLLLVGLLRAAGVAADLALISTGPGEDLPVDMPGIESFNHAILHIAGPAELWVDPTDRLSRAGELPLASRGRRALIVGPRTRELVRTPPLEPRDNGYRESREVFLAPYGEARIVETSTSSGAIELFQRQSVASKEKAAVRRALESYVKEVYLADGLTSEEHPDPDDLGRPFGYRLEVKKAKRGYTTDADAAVVLDRSPLFSWLPTFLKQPPEGRKPRRLPLAMTTAHEVELRYRIVPPPGFKLRSMPETSSRSIGPARMSSTFKHDERSEEVVAVFRFSTGPLEYAPEEVDAFQRDIEHVAQDELASVVYDYEPALLQKEGKTAAALRLYHRLIDRFPQEALYHRQLAFALLEDGFGDEALSEARRAEQLDPGSAVVQIALGWVLEHDRFGRRFGKGSSDDQAEARARSRPADVAAAVKAFRRAIELDPKDVVARASLAELFEFGPSGQRYGEGSNLEGAIAEYRQIKKELKNDSYDPNLAVALVNAKRFKEAREIATRTREGTGNRKEVLLTTTAILDGAKPALELSRKLGAGLEEQRNLLASTFLDLFRLRLYDKGASLLETIAPITANPRVIAEEAKRLRRVRPGAGVVVKADTPLNLVRRMLVELLTGKLSSDEYARLFVVASADESKIELKEGVKHLSSVRRATAESGIPAEASLDYFFSVWQGTVAENHGVGYRVTVKIPGQKGFAPQVWYVQKRERLRLLAEGHDVTALGREALEQIAKGRLDAARRWLDWARDTIPSPPSSSLGPPFAHLWPSPGKAGPAHLRLAAASLLGMGARGAEAIPLLQNAIKRTGAAGAQIDERAVFQARRALAWALKAAKRHAELLPLAEELLAADPRSKEASFLKSIALFRLRRDAELRRWLERCLRLDQRDDDAVMALFDLLARRGKLKEAREVLDRRIDLGDPTATAYNNRAWLALFVSPFAKNAVDDALQANKMSSYSDPYQVHTLAALYAETGNLGEARKLWLKGMELRDVEEPEDVDWYIYGRMAEQVGLRQLAREAYKNVKPDDLDEGAISVFQAAQLRVKRLSP
jgi:tetratricopeptide (TPR) repeat protein